VDSDKVLSDLEELRQAVISNKVNIPQINASLVRIERQLIIEQKEITVWTNGNAIRKYTGQDKASYEWNKEKRNGTWYKAKAIIIPLEEENDSEK
jgi:hypothetical protein